MFRIKFYARIFLWATLLVSSFLLSGCMEKRTDDPKKAYRYWAGENPPKDIKLLHGYYWESAHWSKEYFLYLEMIASKEWIDAYKVQNNFEPFDPESSYLPDDRPTWFNPPKDFKVYSPKGSHTYPTLYEDNKSGHIFLIESIL